MRGITDLVLITVKKINRTYSRVHNCMPLIYNALIFCFVKLQKLWLKKLVQNVKIILVFQATVKNQYKNLI